MNIIGICFSLLCTVGAAIGLLVWALTRKQGLVKPFLFGALCFTLFQLLSRIPLLQYVLPYLPWYARITASMPYLAAAMLGVSASVFEECGRLIIMALFLKRNRRFADGLAFGFGHGSMEAVALVGVGMLALLITGQYATFTPLFLFLSGVERLSTIAMHTAWSVMVLESLATRRAGSFFLALLTHAAVDTLVGCASILGIAPLVTECLLLMSALLFVYYTYKAQKRWPTLDSSNDAPAEQSICDENKECSEHASDETK